MSRREGRGLFTIVLITLHLVFAVVLTASLHASKRTELNGSWRFRIDRIEEGERQFWHKTSPPQTEVVRVPNTWNVGNSRPLHLGITFLDAKGDPEAAIALDAYPLHFSGQRVEDITQAPH